MQQHLEGLLAACIGALVLLAVLGLRPAIVAGRSMEPALVPGDVCIASPWARARTGDVVLFGTAGRRPVLHRVVRVGDRGVLLTQGDANAVADSDTVPASQVRGRVVTVLPFGRALRGWIRAVRGATLLSPSR